MLELLSHLVDPLDPAYRNCFSAICALQLHCEIGQERGELAMLGDVESHLVRGLYGTALAGHDHVTKRVAYLCLSIQTNPTSKHVAHIRSYLTEIRDFVRETEDEFVFDMQEFVVNNLNSSATDWHPLRRDPKLRAAMLDYLRSDEALRELARGLIFKAMVQAHQNVVPDEHFEDKVTFFVGNFSAPLRLYRSILLRIVMSGCDLSKKNRSNWLWDVYILFGAGNAIGGQPVRLVTGDKDIIAAAHEAGIQDSVVSLRDYLGQLAA